MSDHGAVMLSANRGLVFLRVIPSLPAERRQVIFLFQKLFGRTASARALGFGQEHLLPEPGLSEGLAGVIRDPD